MTALIPVSASDAALLARAAALRVDPALTAAGDDARAWTRSRTRTGDAGGPHSQTILPPDRSFGGPTAARGAHGHESAVRWPSSAFFAQYLSQEAMPDAAPARDHAAGTAKYPSLGFEAEIIPPGASFAAAAGQVRRLDITV